MKHRKRDDELAEELFQRRHDPDEWETAPETIDVRPARTSVVSVRLPTAELRAVEAAAKAAGRTLSAYIRAAIAAQLRSPATEPEVAYMISSSMHEPDHPQWRTWNTPPASLGEQENAAPLQYLPPRKSA